MFYNNNNNNNNNNNDNNNNNNTGKIYNNNNNNNNNNVIYTFLLGAFLSSKRFTWIRKRRKIRKISILGDILYILQTLKYYKNVKNNNVKKKNQ